MKTESNRIEKRTELKFEAELGTIMKWDRNRIAIARTRRNRITKSRNPSNLGKKLGIQNLSDL